MKKVEISPEAENDLDDIWWYIAADKPEAASRFISKIVGLFGLIAESPLMGRNRPELLQGMRSLPEGNYIIFYESTDEGIRIIRVLQGSRDLKKLF